MKTENAIALGFGGAVVLYCVAKAVNNHKQQNRIDGGVYSNATGQYLSIEQSLIQAQRTRDSIIDQLSSKNAALEQYKAQIIDVLSTLEFKKGRLKTHFFPDENLLQDNQKEVEKGLVFDSSTGKIKTSGGTTISDLVSFLSQDNMGYKCIWTPPNQQSGTGYCPPSYGQNENTYFGTARATLISSVNSYRSTLTSIGTLKSKLDSIQSKIKSLKSDLDRAAQQDPALLAAKAKADADEKAAKIAADAEIKKLELTKQADAAALSAKNKQTTKMVVIGGLLVAVVVVGVVAAKKIG